MNTTGKLESLCTELDERNDLNMEEKDSTKESLNSYLDFLERNYVGRQIQMVGWCFGTCHFGACHYGARHNGAIYYQMS